MKLNKEVCEIIGAFIGDGYIGLYGGGYTIGFSGDKILDEEYHKYLKSLIKKNFPFTNPRLYYRNDENSLMLKIYSKKLFNFFMKLGFNCGKKSNIIKIPEIILKDKELMNATIRGIFDTDGCIFFDKRKIYKKPYPRITLQIASISLINQLEEYLSKEFRLYVNKDNREGYRNYIEIYGFEQLEKFIKQIGFSNKRHLDRLSLHSSVVA
jgi:hypothetical protein